MGSHHKHAHHSEHHSSGRSHYRRKLHLPAMFGRHSVKTSQLIAGAAVFIAVAAGIFFANRFISSWEQRTYAVQNTQSQVKPNSVFDKAKTVELNGTKYQHRRNLDTYLFIGVDVSGTVEEMSPYDSTGQGDVQLLVVLDHNAKTWQMLQLNRDSMVEIPILGMSGKPIGYETEQLALAHAYGDGREISCRNNADAVSMLLWDEEITGYVSLNMAGIGAVNDAVGGVEVTISTDFANVDPTLELGTTVNLTGEQAINFIRSRMDVDDGSNLSRMARHRQYLSALMEKLMNQNSVKLLDVYQEAEPYMVTSMESGMVVSIAEKMKDYEQLPLLTVDGKAVEGSRFMEYYLDSESLQNTILELFYEIAE